MAKEMKLNKYEQYLVDVVMCFANADEYQDIYHDEVVNGEMWETSATIEVDGEIERESDTGYCNYTHLIVNVSDTSLYINDERIDINESLVEREISERVEREIR